MFDELFAMNHWNFSGEKKVNAQVIVCKHDKLQIFCEFTQNQEFFSIFLASTAPQDKNLQIWRGLILSGRKNGKWKHFDVLKVE